MAKSRGFSIVLHDVQKGLQTKDDVWSRVNLLPIRQGVVAEERYTHQEGSHIHVFLQLKNPVYFSAQLKLWCAWWKSGRVQVDVMKGSMVQACKYLLKDHTKKDKYTDPEPYILLDDNKDREALGVEVVCYATLEDIFFSTMSKIYPTPGQGCPIDWTALSHPLSLYHASERNVVNEFQ